MKKSSKRRSSEMLLSIIIPVYNAAATLAQAVESIYASDLSFPFEIILVDDGSSDASISIIKNLAKKHPEIRWKAHDENKGGGAARNTAVFLSRGMYIFCLDSDDLVTPNLLASMVRYIQQKKCDGVGIHYSQKFLGDDIHRAAYLTTFGYVGQKIPFESLFENSTCALYSTFLHTREAFDICGGYPTSHGFDTQGFAFRFLANGLTAYVCPNATYLHRVQHTRSYYIREYESGRASKNWFDIYEEFFFLFSPKVQRALLIPDTFDIHCSTQELVNAESVRFRTDYKSFLIPYCTTTYAARLSKKKINLPEDTYWLAIYHKNLGKSQEALALFTSLLASDFGGKRLYSHILELLSSMANVSSSDFLMRLEDVGRERLRTKVERGILRIENDVIRRLRKFI